MANVDVLIFAEDPGAANFLSLLPVVFKENGISSELIAMGPAVAFLKQREIDFRPIGENSSAKSIILDWNPKVILLGSSQNLDSMGLKLIAEAKDQGILTVGGIDGRAFADYRFRGKTNNPLAFSPDWLLINDEVTFQNFLQLGFPETRMVICGHPHYKFIRETVKQMDSLGYDEIRKLVLPSFTTDKKLIVFSAELSTGLEKNPLVKTDDYTLFGRGGSIYRTPIVLEEFLDGLQKIGARNKVYLVLRLHPKNSIDEFSSYKEAFDHISVGGSPFGLLFLSNAVVGMTSMLMQEAALFRRTTLSILPRMQEKSWLQTIEAGLTLCAITREEVQECLYRIIEKSYQPDFDRLEKIFPSGETHKIIDLVKSLLNFRKF